MANPILARRQIRQAVIAALQGAGVVPAKSLSSPGDWVTQPERVPAILVRVTKATKEPQATGPTNFTTVVLVELETRVSANSAATAQDELDELDAKVEQALFTNTELIRLVQRFGMEAESEINSEGRNHVGGTRMQLRCEAFEAFDPIYDAPDALQPVAPPLEGVALHVDLAAPFDANGVYESQFAGAVPAAPRTTGPDGRDEGGLEITLNS
ncbi:MULTISPECIES: hypothetical protein [unclassified Duganella]|jgi:hypothetical protein|uniref:hypothetical protein n=1 Tax=unclassified Duganella TaxID=2636909 RepID=UPI000888FCD4|nr:MULTISPECIES: hypothetical protein [unclassified Duganella]SDH06005.1 hypothetical protein SAMN05216320_109145 [Duganella sp. OV458]SDK20088.1 hypothetical protein SAMN05428973_109137 [Duganella sp. OV510]